MQTISIDNFREIFDNLEDNSLILDVRSAEEFNQNRLKGARNVPHEEVAAIAEELKEYDKVYVHCKMGGRAKIASQSLESAGVPNIICVGNGGMQRWIEQGWPVEK